jgi:choline-sulfatase
MSERPNILLVMADQLAAAHLPAYGNSTVHAPRLTQLAREGVVFERAYCASPLCAPSRFSLLAGRRPSSIGAYDNAAELPAGTPTIAHVLRAAGYETTLAGKMHFVGPDQLHGFEERLTTDVYPSDFDWTPDWRLPAGKRLEWYHNTTSLLSSRVTEAAMQTDYDDEVCFRAVQKLRDLSLRDGDRPFFLTVSFTNPHDPWEQRQRYWDLYDEGSLALPAVASIPREHADPHSLRLRDMSLLDERPLSDDEVRHARHGYYAAISYLDERVGELLDALAASGLDGSTLVLFTADHGELLGERGLWYKMSFLDGSARVPLIARGPGVAVGRVSGPVSQLDLAPTLASRAGAAASEAGFEGTTLADALAGASSGPGEALGEYLAEGVTSPMVMIRRGRHKYIRCPGDPDLLFDLDADPSELHNLADQPEGVAVAADLRAESDRRWDLAALEQRVLESQRERHLVARALGQGAYTPWDFQPFSDASFQYVRSDASRGRRPGRGRPAGGLPPSSTGV